MNRFAQMEAPRRQFNGGVPKERGLACRVAIHEHPADKNLFRRMIRFWPPGEWRDRQSLGLYHTERGLYVAVERRLMGYTTHFVQHDGSVTHNARCPLEKLSTRPVLARRIEDGVWFVPFA